MSKLFVIKHSDGTSVSTANKTHVGTLVAEARERKLDGEVFECELNVEDGSRLLRARLWNRDESAFSKQTSIRKFKGFKKPKQTA